MIRGWVWLLVSASIVPANLVAAAEGAPPDCVLTWSGTELTAGNGELMRRWRLDGGLPAAVSMLASGHEWIVPAQEATTTLPAGLRLKPPLSIVWHTAFGRANAVEAPSRRGELTVLGSDGVGYRWSLQVFADCPAILNRWSPIFGQGRNGSSGLPSSSTVLPAAGIESPSPLPVPSLPRSNRLDTFNLRPFTPQFTVVDLVDATDHEDNLAAERGFRLSPKQRVAEATNLVAIDDPANDCGLAILKLEALPRSRPIPTVSDVIAQYREVAIYTGEPPAAASAIIPSEWAVLSYAGGKWGRALALHRLQSLLREYRPGRDGRLLSNTWGDRSQDSRVTENFVAQEITAGQALGVDVCQIDDGWQRGITKNTASAAGGARTPGALAWSGGFWKLDPHFWDPRPNHFPHGLDATVAAARAHGMGLGLWFSPDGADEYANWQRDADAVLGFHRRWGVDYVKIDGTHVQTPIAQKNLRSFIDRVLAETSGAVSFDLDVTADIRPGYFGLIEAGPLFLENRYTDTHTWWPHATLRNLWQLAWYIPPQRLRIEFLNPARNPEKYAGDPLAPAAYPPDYLFAVTLVANPLAWFEVSHLPPAAAAPIRALISLWKTQREALQRGVILPIGDCPSGYSWTGFCSVGATARQVLIFRERTASPSVDLPLPSTRGAWRVHPLAGTGAATWSSDRLHVEIPAPLHYLWITLEAR